MPRPSRRAKHWRVLFVEDGGAVASFENARLLVASILLIILTLSALCTGFFWMYRSAESERRNLSLRTADLERDLAEIRDEKDRLVARMVLGRSGAGESGDAAEKKAPDDKSPSRAQAGHQKPSAAADAVSGLIFPERVAVNEISAIQGVDDKTLDIRFKLINVGPDRISGYVFAVLKTDALHSETWRVVPEVALNAGRPTAHESGQRFSISSYKTIRLRVNDAASYALATLWIFSEDGALLLKHDASLAR